MSTTLQEQSGKILKGKQGELYFLFRGNNSNKKAKILGPLATAECPPGKSVFLVRYQLRDSQKGVQNKSSQRALGYLLDSLFSLPWIHQISKSLSFSVTQQWFSPFKLNSLSQCPLWHDSSLSIALSTFPKASHGGSQLQTPTADHSSA